MRLNKYLASCGVASRRKCEDIIRSGTVLVNGEIEVNPFRLLLPEDSILLDDQEMFSLVDTEVIVLNKPDGYITTTNDPQGRNTVMDLVKSPNRLFPVGRLDKDTTGVLLLTNDGNLAYQLTHPKYQVEKVYRVQIMGFLSNNDIEQIKSGVMIGSDETGQGEVLSQNKVSKSVTEIELVLTQGKKREVRRILSSLGYKVIALQRISFGGITTDGLNLGHWRRLSEEEALSLRREKVVSGTVDLR
ncbi:MAG TPA: rRNA pseudouridine synthase [Candidatus Marinimicrobia bacterium]|jgi:23S rRNA pseudouridine2605 synthase|nr:rRNA pseudouridine synthase [Candidatus Neomarinimicrobiota bacterium]HIA85729.1 rRNA pseudouridine synthase [Candidatus Neomarinimicrobiota bacterium]HIB58050.1 rRNA pseudouridine synthase [Candidatus Neomarinimicrobiota bacterium]